MDECRPLDGGILGGVSGVGDGDPPSEYPYPASHLWPPWTLHNSYADTDDPAAMLRYNQVGRRRLTLSNPY